MVIYPFQGSVLLKGRSETRRKNLPFDKISLRDLFFAKFRGFSDDPRKLAPAKINSCEKNSAKIYSIYLDY